MNNLSQLYNSHFVILQLKRSGMKIMFIRVRVNIYMMFIKTEVEMRVIAWDAYRFCDNLVITLKLGHRNRAHGHRDSSPRP